MTKFTISKSEWNRQNNDAIAILHRAWMDVSGGEWHPLADRGSVALANAKKYLLSQTWGRVA